MQEGRVFTKEHRAKIAEANKGNTNWLGRHHTEKTKKKMSEAQMGEKNHMWGKKWRHTKEAKEKMSIARKGKRIKPHTEEWKRNMKKIMTGRKFSEEHRRKMSLAQIGRIFSKESREKMSRSHLGLQVGEKHPNWQGGISFEPYGIEFNNNLKEQIRNRDGNTCQLCGAIQGKRKFPPHHINYDKKSNNSNNLILLCVGCNGRANVDRSKWQFFFETCQELRL